MKLWHVLCFFSTLNYFERDNLYSSPHYPNYLLGRSRGLPTYYIELKLPILKNKKSMFLYYVGIFSFCLLEWLFQESLFLNLAFCYYARNRWENKGRFCSITTSYYHLLPIFHVEQSYIRNFVIGDIILLRKP